MLKPMLKIKTGICSNATEHDNFLDSVYTFVLQSTCLACCKYNDPSKHKLQNTNDSEG